MELKKTRFAVKYSCIFGIASFICAVLIFFLTKNGVIHKQTVENPDLSQGISYAISIVLFVLYLVAQMVMSFCTAIFGSVGVSAVKKNKNIRAFLTVVAVIEAVFAVVDVFGTITVFGFKFLIGGVFSLLCALGHSMCVITCILSAREIKSCFVNPFVNNEQNNSI